MKYLFGCTVNCALVNYDMNNCFSFGKLLTATWWQISTNLCALFVKFIVNRSGYIVVSMNRNRSFRLLFRSETFNEIF